MSGYSWGSLYPICVDPGECLACGKCKFLFWELSGLFFFSIFDTWLVESDGGNPQTQIWETVSKQRTAMFKPLLAGTALDNGEQGEQTAQGGEKTSCFLVRVESCLEHKTQEVRRKRKLHLHIPVPSAPRT